jgi:CBS domain-containing protein
MASSLATFSPDTELMDAIRQLVERQISGAPVVDGQGNLVGILSERDCIAQALSAGYYGEAGGRVSELMTTDVETVNADDGLMDIAKRFISARYRRFPVLDDNRLVGLISRRDVLRAILSVS